MGDGDVMAVAQGNSQTYLVKILRDLADKVDACKVEIETISIVNDIHEGDPVHECRTWFSTGRRFMEMTFRVLPPKRTVRIDSNEYPVQDCEQGLSDYIRRVLREIGHSETYVSYEMETRPDKSFVLTVAY